MTAPWMRKKPHLVEPVRPTLPLDEAAAEDRQRAAERDNALAASYMQGAGELADDPTYCCDHGEELTALVAWVRELEQRMAELRRQLDGKAAAPAVRLR